MTFHHLLSAHHETNLVSGSSILDSQTKKEAKKKRTRSLFFEILNCGHCGHCQTKIWSVMTCQTNASFQLCQLKFRFIKDFFTLSVSEKGHNMVHHDMMDPCHNIWFVRLQFLVQKKLSCCMPCKLSSGNQTFHNSPL